MSASLTIALDNEGNKVSIENADYGKYCNCICPICKNPVIAKNKKPLEEAKREHHFAHMKGCSCEATDETVLHQWAKDIIVKEKTLMLPEQDNVYRPSGLVRFISVEPEKWDEKYGFRPDIDAITDKGERVLIEFYVSHKVTTKKRNVILKNNLHCIEIDLNYVELEKKSLRSFLLEETSDRTWISASEIKSESKESYSWNQRNPWHDKAIDYIKEQFDKGTLIIGIFERFNIKDYFYDICEPYKKYRNFRSDLLLYRSQKDDKGYIAISIRGRRRNDNHKTPRKLRVIDIIIRNEDDYNKLTARDNLCYHPDFIIYEGFKFRDVYANHIYI